MLCGAARSLIALGRELDVAEGYLRRGMALFAEAHGPDHPALSRTFLGLGEYFLARGEPGDSVEAMQRALTLAGPRGCAEVQLGLARALWAEAVSRAKHRNQIRQRALSLAREASEYYRRIGNQAQLDRALAWIAEREGKR